MQQFEKDYAGMIECILDYGEDRSTRNGMTKGLFGMSLTVDVSNGIFPLIQGRKMYPKGVLGELAAMLRQPKCLEDFEKWGCNYWKLWADDNGKLDIDYGNAWFDFDGFDQIADLKDKLANSPMDRRMIINAWRPNRLEDLSLPCCHYSYQFHVGEGKLNMVWTQRSVDMMIGLPSDIVLAAAWLIAIANEFDLKPGTIKMDLGDCHVYEEHQAQAIEYVICVADHTLAPVLYNYDAPVGADFCTFDPADLVLHEYDFVKTMKLELKA